MNTVYPGADWQTADPAELGFDPEQFAAIGAGYQVIMVCRDLDLAVVQSPGTPTHASFSAVDYGQAAAQVLGALDD